MRAGKLRDYITVEMQAVTPDAYGNVGGAWSARGSFWADVRVTPGKERIEGGTLEATAMATVRLRVSTEAEAITAGDRMVFRGETWNIRNQPVVAGPRREMIEFVAETGVHT